MLSAEGYFVRIPWHSTTNEFVVIVLANQIAKAVTTNPKWEVGFG
jgi:hypothetical protein